VDLRRNRFIYVDHGEETYAETELPVDVSTFLSRGMLERRRDMRQSGEVKPTGRTRKVLDYGCAEYEVQTWPVQGAVAREYSKFKVWACPDLPFDLTSFEIMMQNQRILFNRDHEYRRELVKIDGYQLRLEMMNRRFLAAERVTDQVVEISVELPPAEVFEPPAGYRQISRIRRFAR